MKILLNVVVNVKALASPRSRLTTQLVVRSIGLQEGDLWQRSRLRARHHGGTTAAGCAGKCVCVILPLGTFVTLVRKTQVINDELQFYLGYKAIAR